MSFIVGSYVGVYDGSPIGVIEDGFDLSWVSRGEDIASDVSGDEPIDGVYRGVGMTVSFILSEWNEAGAKKLYWPWAAALGDVGTIGRLYSTIAKPLVLTKCNLNDATPTSFTFSRAIINPGFNIQTTLANKHRKVPIELRILPYSLVNAGDPNQCDLTQLFFTS